MLLRPKKALFAGYEMQDSHAFTDFLFILLKPFGLSTLPPVQEMSLRSVRKEPGDVSDRGYHG